MSVNRKLVFANGEYYHVFNRGVEKRVTFTSKREYIRAIDTLKYYRYHNLPIKYSKYVALEAKKRASFLINLNSFKLQVEIIAYCLMPNHFHFLLKQKEEGGIASFVSKFTNSYTKYFNTKHERVGPLFQGVFKAVRIEDDEQLIHTSRYIHLNPVVGFLVTPEDLTNYAWSSFSEYMISTEGGFINTEEILTFFKGNNEYKKFVLDQVDYSRELKKIEHLIFE